MILSAESQLHKLIIAERNMGDDGHVWLTLLTLERRLGP